MDAPARRDFSRARIRSHLEAWVLSHAPDSDEVRRHKQRMIGAMRGTVVELGPGPGSNMPYYAEGVRVIAIEPNPVMHDPLRRAAEQHGVQLEIRRVHAEDVGVGDGATGAGGIGAGGVGAGGVGAGGVGAGGVGAGGVGAGGVGAGGVGAGGVGAGGVGAGEADGVVGTLVLCGVDDPGLVLQQVRRMLEPGGTYVFFEHVRAPEGSWTRRVQRLVRRPHAWLANGCRVDQDTAALLRDAGFSDVQIEGWDGGLGMGWTRTTIIGHAIR